MGETYSDDYWNELLKNADDSPEPESDFSLVDSAKSFGKALLTPGSSLTNFLLGEDRGEAFTRAAGTTATLGSDDELRAGIDTLKEGGDYMENLDIQAARADELAEEYPYTNIAGTVAGIPPLIVGGTAAATRAGATKIFGSLSKKFPELVNFMKAPGILSGLTRASVQAGGGAVAGTIEAAMEGKDLTSGALWGAGGGVAGVAAGDALKFLLNKTVRRKGAAVKTARDKLVKTYADMHSIEIEDFPADELLAKVKSMPEGTTMAELDDAFMQDMAILATDPKAGEKVKRTARELIAKKKTPSASVKNSFADVFGGPIKDEKMMAEAYQGAKQRVGSRYQDLDATSTMQVNKGLLDATVDDTLIFKAGGKGSKASDMKRANQALKDELVSLADENGNLNAAGVRKFRQFVNDAQQSGKIKTVGGEKVPVDSDTAYALGQTYEAINDRFMHNLDVHSQARKYQTIDDAYSNVIGTKTGFDEGKKFLKTGYSADDAYKYLNKVDAHTKAGYLEGIKADLVKMTKSTMGGDLSASKKIAKMHSIRDKIAEAFDEQTADELIAAADKAMHIDANAKLMKKARKISSMTDTKARNMAKEAFDAALVGGPDVSQAAKIGAVQRTIQRLGMDGPNFPTKEAMGESLGIADDPLMAELQRMGFDAAQHGQVPPNLATAAASGAAAPADNPEYDYGPLMEQFGPLLSKLQ